MLFGSSHAKECIICSMETFWWQIFKISFWLIITVSSLCNQSEMSEIRRNSVRIALFVPPFGIEFSLISPIFEHKCAGVRWAFANLPTRQFSWKRSTIIHETTMATSTSTNISLRTEWTNEYTKSNTMCWHEPRSFD